MQIVQNLIDQGVNAVAVSVLDASSIAPVVEAAKAKHVTRFTSDSDARSPAERCMSRKRPTRVWATRSSTRW
jgi:ABC-type sugar transport system substrate-binding protein